MTIVERTQSPSSDEVQPEQAFNRRTAAAVMLAPAEMRRLDANENNAQGIWHRGALYRVLSRVGRRLPTVRHPVSGDWILSASRIYNVAYAGNSSQESAPNVCSPFKIPHGTDSSMTASNQPPTAPQVVSPQSPVVQDGAPVEVQAIASLVKGFIEPLARSQETAENEKTKRAQIEANTARIVLGYSFSLAGLLVVVSIIALFLGKDQLTEKIVFAVVGFIGGFAFGKTAPHGKE